MASHASKNCVAEQPQPSEAHFEEMQSMNSTEASQEQDPLNLHSQVSGPCEEDSAPSEAFLAGRREALSLLRLARAPAACTRATAKNTMLRRPDEAVIEADVGS